MACWGLDLAQGPVQRLAALCPVAAMRLWPAMMTGIAGGHQCFAAIPMHRLLFVCGEGLSRATAQFSDPHMHHACHDAGQWSHATCMRMLSSLVHA
jgi:hypothetical protein